MSKNYLMEISGIFAWVLGIPVLITYIINGDIVIYIFLVIIELILLKINEDIDIIMNMKVMR